MAHTHPAAKQPSSENPDLSNLDLIPIWLQSSISWDPTQLSETPLDLAAVYDADDGGSDESCGTSSATSASQAGSATLSVYRTAPHMIHHMGTHPTP